MADYKTHIDEKTGITFVEVSGAMLIEEHVRYMKSEAYAKRTSRLVADVRQASMDAMSRGTIAKMVRNVKPLEKSGVRAAYVFNKGEDLSKAKAMIAQLEVLGYSGKFKLFTDLGKAVSWVQKQE